MDTRTPAKTVLITGATDGIGWQTARTLAAQGHHVLLGGRDRTRGEQALQRLRDVTGNPRGQLVLGDLTRRDGVQAVAAQVRDLGVQLDLLLHNAGLMPSGRVLTDDGIESGFAVNVVAPLLLTQALVPQLAPHARIVAVTGGEHPDALQFDNLQGERSFVGLVNYSHHKLVMMATMRALARELRDTGVTVNVCYPGQAATSMTRGVTAADLPGWMRLLYPLFRLAVRADGGKSAAKASRSSVFLATAAELEGVTERYVAPDCKTRQWPQAIADDVVVERAWQAVHQIAGLNPQWPQALRSVRGG